MTRAACVVLLMLGYGHVLSGQQWSQWRGPERNGVVSEASAPTEWPERYDVAWRVEVGEGYSSPVMANGRVFVQSRRDPQELVTAVDAETGRVEWQQTYPAPYEKNSYATSMAKGPNATPLVVDGRVITMSATGVVSAWDERTGRPLWKRDYSESVDFSSLFCGTAASPLLAHGHVIVQVGSDVGGGRIVALDPATGETRWEWRGAGPGYASPGLVDVNDTSQVVTLTNESIVGLNARTGLELWSTPFGNSWHENIVTPLWAGGLLVASSKEQGTVAYRIAEVGGAWRAEEAWRNQTATMYMSTPVTGDGVLYGLSNKRLGSFVAIDLTTGELRWQTEGREGETAAVLLTNRHVVYLTDEATLVVAGRDPATFAPAHRYDLGTGATWTTPVVAGSDLIVKDANSLVRLAGRR